MAPTDIARRVFMWFCATLWHYFVGSVMIPLTIGGLVAEYVFPEWFGGNGQPIVTSKKLFVLFMHSVALVALVQFCLACTSASTFYNWKLIATFFVMEQIAGFGVTMGLHRYYTHESYKMNWFGRAVMFLMSTFSAQGSIYWWSKKHWVHHKYQDSAADPYSVHMGAWFAHVGWLYRQNTPEHREKMRAAKLPHLENDALIMWQHEHRGLITLLARFVFPTVVGWYFFDSIWLGYAYLGVLSWVVCLHNTWLINSLAHMIGEKPYNAKLSAIENVLASFGAHGEGWHNYHHTYPRDYRCAEWGGERYNPTAALIDGAAKVGIVYDRYENHRRSHGD